MDIISVPLKPFGLAKARLADAFGGAERESLGRRVAAHTLAMIERAFGTVWVVTSDAEVGAWARSLGAKLIDERPGSGLNGAAANVVGAADGGRWMIVHADLPLLRPDDIHAAWDAIPPSGLLLAPSHDGGTSVLGGTIEWTGFAYGPGSFRRHLGRAGRASVRVLARTGFLLDIDSPSDYRAAVGSHNGSWLEGRVPPHGR